MSTDIRHPMVLIADDDPDDQLMIREAFEERCSDCELRFVCNGVELMAYLRRKPDQNQPSRHSRCPICCCSTLICRSRTGGNRCSKFAPIRR